MVVKNKPNDTSTSEHMIIQYNKTTSRYALHSSLLSYALLLSADPFLNFVAAMLQSLVIRSSIEEEIEQERYGHVVKVPILNGEASTLRALALKKRAFLM